MSYASYARRTTGMSLLSLAFLIAGCNSGGSAQGPPPQAPGNPPPDPPPTQTSGLDARPSNTTCIAPERATGSATIGTQRAFPNINFLDPTTRVTQSPLLMLQAPRDASRWFVLERPGVVRVFDNDEGVAASAVFLDIDSRVDSTCPECGLLGMAFHPDFPTTPRVYLTYTAMQRTGGGPDTHLSELTSPDGGLTLDPDSERVILAIKKPGTNHHGGHVAFGPDGLLYFATGDGNGSRIDAAQLLTSLLGKFIRIDIGDTTGTALYRIPPDNPFASSTTLCNENGSGPQNCPEIYAWGLRNPWRWSFDRATADIWAGDVGETAREEIDRIVLGGNYGWRCFEGTQRTTRTCEEPENPRPPIAEYDHSVGRAVTGGYVYRGTAIPGLIGRYVFGDFASGCSCPPVSAGGTATIACGSSQIRRCGRWERAWSCSPSARTARNFPSRSA